MGGLAKAKLIFHLFWGMYLSRYKELCGQMGVCLTNQKLALKTRFLFLVELK